MIEIKNRYNGSVIYIAKNAKDIRQAVEQAVRERADLAGAHLRGANLADANLADAHLRGAHLRDANLADAHLRGANLTGANLADANLADADLTRANLADADLTRADLTRANLTGANLADANLADAYLADARGIHPDLTDDLRILLDQVGKIRAYKLVNSANEGPQYGGVKYEIGQTVETPADTTDKHCAHGINLATLPWCLRNWHPGCKVLVVEFTRNNIASIPAHTDGKFRVHKCKVIREHQFDPAEIGLTREAA